MNKSLVRFIKKSANGGTPGVSNLHIRDTQSRRDDALSDMLVIGSTGQIDLGSAVVENDITYTPPA